MALNPLDPIVRDLAEVKRQLAGRSQLNHSSLENTAIPVYDGDGQERLRIGAQDDGTHAIVYVQGPPPPRPTPPVVSVDGPVVRVRWDGALMGGHIPEDFARIDVHFALATDDLEAPAAVRANLATAAGSEATLMATQTGTYRVGLVAMSQSRARSEMSETVEVEVQVVDLATAIETAAQSANGKNTVVYSERSPEPTDEGAEGDTWWVNEVRPRDPEDPAAGVVIAITEQWQHTGTVWVQVEMAHEVIASVDLGRAEVGFLHGERIEAGTIDTPQLAFGAATGDILAVDALNFKRAVGLDLASSSFRAGDAVKITEEYGIRQFGPDGALNVSLPSDGSPAEFRGDLSARTLTATGRMSIQGPGAIASGGVLELESGGVPPVRPPSVSSSLQTTKFPPVADDESVWGLAWADGHWWRAVDVSGMSEGDRIEKITPTGELVTSFPIVFFPRNGMTAIGDELFLLGIGDTRGVDRDTSKRYVRVYGLDGTFKRQWEYEEYGTGTHQPGIGTNGADLVIAQTWATTSRAHTLTWRRYNPTSGALRDETHTSYSLGADVVGINLTSADYGTQRVLVTTGRGTGAVEMYTPTGTHISAGGWYANDHQRVRGTAWANGRFHHLTENGDLITMSTTIYPNGEPGPDTNDWWAALAWYDGTSETTIGPARRFTFMRRTDLRLSFGTPPEGAPAARVYLARKTTEPSRADFHLVGEVPTGAGQATIILPTGWAQAATPPAANSFPNSTPGIIRSTLGQFEVDGLGAGTWGPLTFHEDGSMTGIPKIASGTVLMDAQVAGETSAMTVTLPAGMFQSAPDLVVSSNTAVPFTTVRGVSASNVTEESFRVHVNRTNATATWVAWIAVGE